MRVRPTNLIALFAMPAFAPALAPFVASWHWALDLLACFVVQAMGTLWVAATVLLAVRRWQLAIPYAIGAALATIAVVPRWCEPAPAAVSTAATAARDLRVASINLLRGADAGLVDALARIRERDSDVVFFSELTPEWFVGLAEGLPALPHRCVHADPGYYGAGLFSRWPLRSQVVVPLGVDWAPAIRAIVETPAGPLGVLGVHTPRPGSRDRAAKLAKALAAIPAAIADLPAARIVFGDFNATPWNAGFCELLRATGLDAATERDHHPTWPSNLPWPLRIPIDHVLVSAMVETADVHVGASFGSDHLPLFATLRLAGRDAGTRR